MLTSEVVLLEAIEEGALSPATGRAVHGLWFRVWQKVDPELASRLHTANGVLPFTLSPLLGLPRPSKGKVQVKPGQQAWFRVTTLTEDLSTALEEVWLPALPSELELGGLGWRVVGHTRKAEEHPWAGRVRYGELASRYLFGKTKPVTWQLRFATPTAFHGSAGHLPFPLPESLVNSWLRRWNAFAPIALPVDLGEQVRKGVVVSAYALRTVPVRYGERLIVGGVGWAKLRALALHPAMRAAVHVLAHYAFYCGSGAKTAQGMGMSRLEEKQKNPA